MIIRRADDQTLPLLVRLLADSELPVDGVADHLHSMLVAEDDGRVVGCAGLELYAEGALLRSVAVARSHRGRGLGLELTSAALELAERHGAPAVYLLTTTAEEFFPKFGFERISRSDVPPSVQQSVEFVSACCASAIVMRKRLAPSPTC
jgi:amino-acid N-acetyltransferase